MKVEVAVLGYPPPNSSYSLCGREATLKLELLASGTGGPGHRAAAGGPAEAGGGAAVRHAGVGLPDHDIHLRQVAAHKPYRVRQHG